MMNIKPILLFCLITYTFLGCSNDNKIRNNSEALINKEIIELKKKLKELKRISGSSMYSLKYDEFYNIDKLLSEAANTYKSNNPKKISKILTELDTTLRKSMVFKDQYIESLITPILDTSNPSLLSDLEMLELVTLSRMILLIDDSKFKFDKVLPHQIGGKDPLHPRRIQFGLTAANEGGNNYFVIGKIKDWEIKKPLDTIYSDNGYFFYENTKGLDTLEGLMFYETNDDPDRIVGYPLKLSLDNYK